MTGNAAGLLCYPNLDPSMRDGVCIEFHIVPQMSASVRRLLLPITGSEVLDRQCFV